MSEAELRERAARGRWRAVTVDRIRDLGEGSSRGVLELLAPLGVNDNQMRDMLDLLEDTAARRRTTVADVIAAPEVAAVRDRELGRSDKIKMLKACLRRLRYPQLTAALDRIAALRSELGLPRGCSIRLPENLEGDEVVLTIRATSVEQLRTRVRGAARACEGSELDSIFDVWEEAEG